MTGVKREDSSGLYTILSHPMRRDIIRLLGKREVMGFTELRETLNTSVGTLYYHFDVLGNLIAQDKNRKYRLTDRGRLAYRALSGEKEGEELKVDLTTAPGSPRALLLTLFAPRGLFTYLYSSPLRFVPEALIILLYGTWVFSQSSLEPMGLFVTVGAWTLPHLIMVEFLAGWLVFSLLSSFLALVLFGRHGGDLDLLVGVAFSFLPLLFFPSLVFLNIYFGLGLPLVGNTVVDIFFFVFQGWALCLLTTAIGSAKGLKMERAVIISLIILYLNIGYVLLLRRPL
jgi:DNA-binding transcriptional ArsR family regulator